MASKGNTGHVKSLNSPKFAHIHKKEHEYTTRQNPGRHSHNKSIALTIFVEKTGVAGTRREANQVIRQGLVSVNGSKVMEPKFPVGLHDMIAVGDEKHVIKVNSRGQIHIVKDDKKSAQLYKVVGKYKFKKNSIMLRLHDGSAVKGDDSTNVDDSVLMEGGKVSKVIKFNSGSRCEIVDGVHVGREGTIKEVHPGNIHKDKSVTVEEKSGKKFETLVKNIIIVE